MTIRYILYNFCRRILAVIPCLTRNPGIPVQTGIQILKTVFVLCCIFCTFHFLPTNVYASAEWEVTLRVEAGTGHNRLVLGADATAENGYDPLWDVYTMLGGEIEAYFPHPEWGMVHQVFSRDIRSKTPGTTTEWLFEVNSYLNNSNFTIKWDLSKVPNNYTIFLDTTAQQIDMRLNTFYSFLYTDSRTFRVAVYVPPDVTPPNPPQNLTGKSSKAGVVLSWKRNRELDIAGYNVYRSTTHGSGYQKINYSLISVPKYIDKQVVKSNKYYYVVTAVNTAGGESGYSNEVAVTAK